MTIWKFVLQEAVGFEPQPLAIPQGAEIIHVAAQGDRVCLWALLEPPPTRPPERWFILVPTGEHVHADWEYLGTAHILTSLGELVLHVFELER